ncbi:hypothetical protein GCM10009839_14240 [Catenulispora yoronensis]|uniref:DUF4307 domain-containing protein n=1 Tax=Catenulispora yoronensis TaxID=450799 RepID=A0ABN2TSX9_9ACTN
MADAEMTRRQKWTIAVIAFTVVVLTLGAIGVVYKAIQHQRAATDTTVTITVQDKRNVCHTVGTGAEATQSCHYEIYTDAGVFANHDEYTAHKLNSDMLFGQLMYGGVYQVEVRGARHDNVGIFPNIIRIVTTVKPGHPSPPAVIATANP